MSLIKNIEFRNVSNTFQEQLANDIKEIKCTNKIVVPADTTRNLHKVEKEDYKKITKKAFHIILYLNLSIHQSQMSVKLAKLLWTERTKKLHLLYKLTSGKTLQQ